MSFDLVIKAILIQSVVSISIAKRCQLHFGSSAGMTTDLRSQIYSINTGQVSTKAFRLTEFGQIVTIPKLVFKDIMSVQRNLSEHSLECLSVDCNTSLI